MTQNYLVAALYCFARFDRYEELQAPLKALCKENGVKGTLLLAHEGINGTIAGPEEGIKNVVDFITAQPELAEPELKYSNASKMPFLRMKVRLKKEIVTMGVEGVDPLKKVGTYIAPQDWNALIEDEDTILIDTRNDYELEVGTFKGAIDPNIKTFREFPQWIADHDEELRKKKKIAMFCTGGIRCEKSTAYVRGLGFDEVYHLKGGILKYLEEIPQEQSLWDGECFVFDERVSVGHGLQEGDLVLCRACRRPLSPEDLTKPHYEAGISCESCYGERSEEDRARFRERDKQIKLAKKRGGFPHVRP
ncbi:MULTISPECIES: oxygen-dependent tRNA uridine(34) hydroxylase TrhO [unclassified Bartonella]|uniref:oxygen-dependent tRNA uridine(34) hydroxylase TrhO n=1 Tax=unclassified Bartonella TaxID=2645622 RepID=UPI0015FD761E|nr:MULTISPECIES: rhodanese-related sulfurtransferase [unclassified Bartonella]UXN04535.1 rhodanese-related sulfurtransferase [Bartonella sp. HY406]UXN07578.1 rhodanese-related sulfurtransferase [Bartonella sp. HY761]